MQFTGAKQVYIPGDGLKGKSYDGRSQAHHGCWVMNAFVFLLAVFAVNCKVCNNGKYAIDLAWVQVWLWVRAGGCNYSLLKCPHSQKKSRGLSLPYQLHLPGVQLLLVNSVCVNWGEQQPPSLVAGGYNQSLKNPQGKNMTQGCRSVLASCLFEQEFLKINCKA